MLSRALLLALKRPFLHLNHTCSISTDPPTKPPTEETTHQHAESPTDFCTGVDNNSGDGNGTNSELPEGSRPEFPGKVRMGFLPEEWFQFFYPITGVTGPYTFGVGLLTYLCSKEIYVMEHEYYSGLSLAIMTVAAVKFLGPNLANWADQKIDEHENKWVEMHNNDIAELEQHIETEKLEQWRAEGAIMLLDAKEENINLQIEAAYREEAMQVFQEVIRRLEYQVACRNIEGRIGHKHMVFWVREQVINAISSKQDELDLAKSSADLSAMVVRVNDTLKEQEIAEKTNQK